MTVGPPEIVERQSRVQPSIAITIGPIVLVAAMSGVALEVTTGLAAGLPLPGTAAAGFHDIARSSPRRAGTTPRITQAL